MLGYKLQATKDHSRFLSKGWMDYPSFERGGTKWLTMAGAFSIWTEYEIKRRVLLDGRPRLRLVSMRAGERGIHGIVRSKPPCVKQIYKFNSVDFLALPPVQNEFFVDIARQEYEFCYLFELIGEEDRHIDLASLELSRILAYQTMKTLDFEHIARCLHYLPGKGAPQFVTYVATSHPSDAIAIKLMFSDKIVRMWSGDGKLVKR